MAARVNELDGTKFNGPLVAATRPALPALRSSFSLSTTPFLTAKRIRGPLFTMSNIPFWVMNLPLDKITRIASDNNVSPMLVAAIVQVESAGQQKALRYEPAYQHLWKTAEIARHLAISEATEASMQRHSFGLMQVMGGTARWLGFRGYLTDLLDPVEGLTWGCRYLNRLTNQWKTGPKIIAAYNAGSPRLSKENPGEFVNQKYVDKVKRYLDEISGGSV